MAGGRKLRVSCGPVVTINPSKQEAKGGSDEAQDSIVLSMSNELLYLVPKLHTHNIAEPHLDVLSLQSGCPGGTSISKSMNNIPQFPIAWRAIQNVNFVDVDQKGVPRRGDFPVQVNVFSSLGGE